MALARSEAGPVADAGGRRDGASRLGRLERSPEGTHGPQHSSRNISSRQLPGARYCGLAYGSPVLRGAVDAVPMWLLLIAVVTVIVGLVLVLVWLIRRLVPAVTEGFDAEVASQMLGVVAALFGLLLAFIIVIAYQDYGDTRNSVSREADALAAVVRDSATFPQAAGDEVRSAVGAYVRIVVHEEWPRMNDGEQSARAWAAVEDVYTALQAIEPSSARTEAFYNDAVGQLNAALEARRDRLDDAEGGLPWVIAVLLLVGSFVILGYTVLVGSRSFGFHAIGSASIALVVGLSLVVLIALVYPFSGDLAIDPAPFRTGSLAQFFGP